MRIFLAALVIIIAGGLYQVAAQEGCTMVEPCPFDIDIIEGVLQNEFGGTAWTFTSGDAVALLVINFDNRSYDLAIVGHTELLVPSFDDGGVEDASFAIGAPGVYSITLDGLAAGTVVVEEPEEFQGERNRLPWGKILVVVVAVGVVIWLVKRKKSA